MGTFSQARKANSTLLPSSMEEVLGLSIIGTQKRCNDRRRFLGICESRVESSKWLGLEQLGLNREHILRERETSCKMSA